MSLLFLLGSNEIKWRTNKDLPRSPASKILLLVISFSLTSFKRDIYKCLKLFTDPQNVPASGIIKDEIFLKTCFSKTQMRLKRDQN